MNTKEPQWGFTSPDGYFQPIHALTTKNLEYSGSSMQELEELLNIYIQTEQYETCAIIRDEITRRIQSM